jgi:FkbM family methyltransferase
MKIFDKSIFQILSDNCLPVPSSVVQVGASVGQELKLFSDNCIERGIFIEPLSDQYSVLAERVKDYKSFIAMQALVTAFDGQAATFYISSNSGESSSILKPSKHLMLYPSVKFDEPIELTGWSLDSLIRISIEHSKFDHCSCELLYMDVQGAELEVIKGASRQLTQGKYVYTEIGLGTGYQNEAEMEAVLFTLRNYGYRTLALELNVPANYGNCLLAKF